MFIKWNNTNVHALPFVTMVTKTLRNKRTGKRREVQVPNTAQTPQDVKWFRPGWNEFPSMVWTQNFNHPQIQKFLRKKTIEVMAFKAEVVIRDAKGKKKKIIKVIGLDDAPIKLKYFPDKMAISVVKSTWDRDLLSRWLDEERRFKVKRAIDKQLKPLMATADSDEDDSDEDDGDDE